jgi:hypothetical protein
MVINTNKIIFVCELKTLPNKLIFCRKTNLLKIHQSCKHNILFQDFYQIVIATHQKSWDSKSGACLLGEGMYIFTREGGGVKCQKNEDDM